VFDTSEYRRSTGPGFHNAIGGWSLGATGKNVTLAIIDTGIDTANPEFAGRVSPASADVAGNRGLINPDSSHGTQVALTAAAARNGTGIVGIAWEATIQMLRADDPGTCASADGCGLFDTDIAAGVDRAIAANAKVLNLSLGGSPPSQTMRDAVGRAAAAGIVVVVSAGNDGAASTDQPDPFAVGLQQAGNGNVIIAGSVDATGTISSFSNHAGSEANAYLMALGERVCCVYENGQIKITTDGQGNQFVTVVSGTSFSAPQIAGAAALLRQYFPNLSATQVVNLLLSTARDAGAAGTDAIYGRGILDVGNAFAPQGTTSLAGSSSAQVPIGGTSVITSSAMGDAGQGAVLPAVVLDSYQRAYRIDLGRTLRSAGLSPKLAGALLEPARNVSAGSDSTAIAFSIADRPGLTAGGGWGSPLLLSAQDGRAARVLAARVVSRIAPGTSFAFAYGLGADGIVAQLQGQSRPAFLIAGSPADDFGFVRNGETAYALRRSFGRLGLSLSAENGKVVSGAPHYAGNTVSPRLHDAYFRMGLALDRRFGPVETSLGATLLNEQRTILGARLEDGLGGRGADSVFLDLAATWQAPHGWRLGGAWRQGWTRVRGGGAVLGGSRLVSNGWSVDLSRSGLFQRGDTLSLRLSQPLRVSSGGIDFTLPDAYSYDTLETTNALRRVSLSPHGREISRELAWRGWLAGGTLAASVFWRSDPGHYANRGDDIGAGASWSMGF
jgi:hypothetical protein